MLLAKNRKAFHEHKILETLTAGMVLRGYEVKAIKEGNVNFDGAFVQVLSGVPHLVNLYIGRYSKQSQDFNEANSRHSRKLLLKKKEIEGLQKDLIQKGRTAIPLALVVAKNLVKLEFGVVQGLKKQEKKNVEKEKQIKRDMEIEVKELSRL